MEQVNTAMDRADAPAVTEPVSYRVLVHYQPLALASQSLITIRDTSIFQLNQDRSKLCLTQPVLQIPLATQRMKARPLCPKAGLQHSCRYTHRPSPHLAFASSGVESSSARCPAMESDATGLLLGLLAAERQEHNLGEASEMLGWQKHPFCTLGCSPHSDSWAEFITKQTFLLRCFCLSTPQRKLCKLKSKVFPRSDLFGGIRHDF